MPFGGKTEDILAAIPMEAAGEGESDTGDTSGLQNAMADLSVALQKNEPKAAAMAFKQAFQLAMLEME